MKEMGPAGGDWKGRLRSLPALEPALAKRLPISSRWEGASVIVNGLPDDPIADVARAIRERGGEAIPKAGDVSDENSAWACIELALTKYDRLDILINNAGVFLDNAMTEDYPLEDFDRTIRMNIRSAFMMTRFALPHLQKTRGNIVSAGSESGMIGLAQNTTYGGTKGWMHAFMRGVAVEQAQNGVRANCVCPGPIDTAWTHKETGPMDKEMEKSLIQAVPLARRGTTGRGGKCICVSRLRRSELRDRRALCGRWRDDDRQGSGRRFGSEIITKRTGQATGITTSTRRFAE